MRRWRGVPLAVLLALLMGGGRVAPLFADHEVRFKGLGGGAPSIGLIAGTVVGALLGFGALLALVRLWERKDGEACRRRS